MTAPRLDLGEHAAEDQEYIRSRRKEHPDTGCWEWTQSTSSTGYGLSRRRGMKISAHRLSYAAFVGPIPEGMCIDHLCRNRRCVNPRHMEVVTLGENVMRGMSPTIVAARNGVCKHGHQLSGDNLYTRIRGGHVQHQCKACCLINRNRTRPSLRASRRAGLAAVRKEEK